MIKSVKGNLSNEKGLTLVELVIVIAILGVLSVIGLMQFNKILEDSKVATDAEVENQANSALQLAIASISRKGTTLDLASVTTETKSYFQNDTFPALQSQPNRGKAITVTQGAGVTEFEITIA